MREDGEQAGDGRDRRPRQWFNVPVPDIIGRIKGDINYGHGRVAKGTNLLMKFWGKTATPPIPSRATTPGSSPRTSAGASSSPRSTSRRWSTRSTARTSGARRPRRWASPAADIPASTSRGKETFFDGKVFDPADHAGLPASRCRSSAPSSDAAPAAVRSIRGDTRMNMPMLKAETAAAVPARAPAPSVVRCKPPQARASASARIAAARCRRVAAAFCRRW